MASAVRLREDDSAAELRALARRSKNVNQSRRLLSLAAVRDGNGSGSAAAKIGGMDRQTLRDWVHRFHQGRVRRRLIAQLDRIVTSLAFRRTSWLSSRSSIRGGSGSLRRTGVVRWRRLDLKRVIA